MLKTSDRLMSAAPYFCPDLGRRRLLVGVALAGLASLMSGCAGMTPDGSDAWQTRQRTILAERAEARWKAQMAGDFEKAYRYLSPARRLVVSLQQFKSGFGDAVDWRVARAVDIQYHGPTVASISMEVTYRFVMPRSGGNEIESKRILVEKWLYSDGEWWYISG
jgi:hypothetical protein